MKIKNRNQQFALLGMFGAAFFFLNLLLEYQFDLFPPNTGTLYAVNQLMFYIAMGCLLLMLVGLWQTGAAGRGWFGRFALGLFIFGLATLILGGFIMLFTGNDELILFPIGGISQMLGGILTGIGVIAARQWTGWQRFAPLALGLFDPVVSAIRGTPEPTLLIESIWMLLWVVVSFAFYSLMKTTRLKPAAGTA